MPENKWFYRDGQEFVPGPFPFKQINDHAAETEESKTCFRCGGAGSSEAWAHTGRTCYQCGGSGNLGWKTVKLYSAEKLAKLNATAEKRNTKTAEKRRLRAETEEAARLAAIPETHKEMERLYPEAVAILRGEVQGDFLVALKEKFENGVPLTDRMAEAVVNTRTGQLERNKIDALVAEFEAVSGEVETGRQDIRAILLGVKRKRNKFSYNGGMILKGLFLSDHGFKVYGTLPQGADEEDRGTIFTFKATLERSKDDPRFGFYKRPSEAVMEA